MEFGIARGICLQFCEFSISLTYVIDSIQNIDPGFGLSRRWPGVAKMKLAQSEALLRDFDPGPAFQNLYCRTEVGLRQPLAHRRLKDLLSDCGHRERYAI